MRFFLINYGSNPLTLQHLFLQALLVHLNLLLPTNISVVFFDVIVKGLYNLQLVQILLKLTLGLSRQEKEMLKQQYVLNEEQRAGCPELKEDGNLAAAMGRIIANMENVKLYVGFGASLPLRNITNYELSFELFRSTWLRT
jgi:hypothetical protein